MKEKTFLNFYKDNGDICDSNLWKEFIKNLKDKIKFIGISYQDPPIDDDQEIKSENSTYYIKLIDKRVRMITNNYENKDFQFDFSTFHEIVLKLWRELLKDAIVFLKKEDGREEYHDRETFGVDELYKYFTLFVEFEEVLYENIQFYRDHVFHVFRVFLLGLQILFNKIKLNELETYEKKIIKQIIKEIYGDNLSDEEILSFKQQIENKLISDQEKIAMWIIISLTHDLGYPLEKLSTINRKVRKMLEAFGRSSIQEIEITFPPQGEFINDFVLRFISTRLILDKDKSNNNDDNGGEKKDIIKLEDLQFHLHIQSKYWLKFSRSFEEYNHSIISCILLMKYLVYFLESDYLLDKNHNLGFKNQRQFQIRKEILKSIAVHNCEYIYHLKPNNFGFLLTIVDDLQCWGRPSGRITTHGSSWKIQLHEFSQKKVEFTMIVTEANKNTDIRRIFLAQARKYTKIFRGGVDGKYRDFNLYFRVIISKEEYYKWKDSKRRKIIGLEYCHEIPRKSKESMNFYKVNVKELCLEDGNIEEKPIIVPLHVYIAHTEKKDYISKTYKEIKENLAQKIKDD